MNQRHNEDSGVPPSSFFKKINKCIKGFEVFWAALGLGVLAAALYGIKFGFGFWPDSQHWESTPCVYPHAGCCGGELNTLPCPI